MLRNYFKVAFRNILNEKIYALINVAGLGIGLAASLVILTFVISEFSFDKKFNDHEQIYRVGVGFANMGPFASGPEILAPTILEEIPFVETVTNLHRDGTWEITVDNKEFAEQKVYRVDSNYFNLFSYPFLEGSANTAIVNLSSIVISMALADIYFRDQTAIGKTIEIGKVRTPYIVSGVVDNSSKSHMEANIWLQNQPSGDTHWMQAQIYTYVKLREEAKIEDLRIALNSIIEYKIYPNLNKKQSFDQWIKTDAAFKFDVQELSKIYFQSQAMFELSAGGNIQFIYIFSSIAIFILVLASINFINLSTARSSRRGKEVGVRKSLGGSKGQLISQFLMESLVMSTLSLLVGLAVYEGFIVVFEHIMDLKLTSVFGLGGQFLLAFAISSGIGLVAGIYPALNLTRFKTVAVLKSNSAGVLVGNSNQRNLLVIFQFTISITLIISTLLVQDQLDYLKSTDVGFNRENILIINSIGKLGEAKEAVKKELDQHSAVSSSAFASRVPAGSNWWTKTYTAPGMTESLSVQTFFGDENYLNTLKIRLVEGKNFAGLASDTSKVILNEAAVKAFGLEDPVGSLIQGGEYSVIGVMNDFNFESLTRSIAPVVLQYDYDIRYSLAYKLKPNQSTEFISYAREVFADVYPDEPINYRFLDESFNALLHKEDQLAEGILSFAGIAILISCLGLFGLSAYAAERRSKELGVRKVLGASVRQLVIMLTKSFTFPVLIAITLASPLAYLIMKQWKSAFVYQAQFSFSIFVIAGVLALILTWITVGYFALSAASQSPTKTLRDE